MEFQQDKWDEFISRLNEQDESYYGERDDRDRYSGPRADKFDLKTILKYVKLIEWDVYIARRDEDLRSLSDTMGKLLTIKKMLEKELEKDGIYF